MGCAGGRGGSSRSQGETRCDFFSHWREYGNVHKGKPMKRRLCRLALSFHIFLCLFVFEKEWGCVRISFHVTFASKNSHPRSEEDVHIEEFKLGCVATEEKLL